jgi:hypothetical protein
MKTISVSVFGAKPDELTVELRGGRYHARHPEAAAGGRETVPRPRPVERLIK